MDDHFLPTLIGWIIAVDVPLLTAFLMMGARFKRDVDQSLTQMRDALALYKLDVAQAYASIQQVKDLEARLVSHLLRIETKLENSMYSSHRDKG